MATESATLAPDDLSDLGGQVVYRPKPAEAQSAPPAGSDDLSDLGGKLVYHPQQAANVTNPTNVTKPTTGPSVAEGQNEGWMPKGGGQKPLGNNPVFRPGNPPALQQPIAHPPNAPTATYNPSPQESADLPPANDLHAQASEKYGFLHGQNVEVVDKRGTKSPYQSETWAAGNVADRPKQYDPSKNYVEQYSNKFSPDDYAAEVFSHIDPKGQQYAQRFLSSLNPSQLTALKNEALDYRDTLKNGQPEADALKNAAQSALRGYVFSQWPADAWQQFGLRPEQKALLDEAKHYAVNGNQPPAQPTATMGARSAGIGERILNVVRNSPLGHAIQSEFPDAPEWIKPTTKQGTEEYRQEEEQPRLEQLTEGLTQEQAEWLRKFSDVAGAIPSSGATLLTPKIQPGQFRATPGAGATPTEEKLGGAAKTASTLIGGPGLATQVGIMASAGLAGEALAAPLVPEMASKVVHAMMAAGFTGQMATGVVDDIKTYHEAKQNQAKAEAAGDSASARQYERQANETIGSMSVNGTLAALAGADTVHAVKGLKSGNVPHVPRETPQAESTSSNITIGDTEPETGRPVMQQSAKPEVSQAAATAEHPDIKSQIQEAVKPIGGARLAGERDEKAPDRVQEKIEDEGQSPRTMRDFSGFRIAVDSPAAATRAVDALRSKFEVVDESNEFHEGNPETGFHGWTVQVREPGSPVSHEVQVVPREVAETADARHPLYEKAREGDKAAAAELKQANDADWQKFQARHGEQPAGETKYKYGNTQTNIPEGSPASAALDEFRKSVPDEDLAAKGKDVGDGGNHVTVRYGIDGDNTQGIERFIRSQKPFRAKLGETEVFPPTKNSDGAAVLVANIDSPEFHRLNDEIEQHGKFAPSDFKDYKPHATIAYLDPAKAEGYKGRQDLKGRDFEVKSIAISDRNGGHREIPLEGKAVEAASPVERRANDAERKRVSEMSPEEMQRTLLTSDVTGLPNRRAYDEAERGQRSPAVAMSDADGLKALNDKFGYDAGNALLKAKAEALQNAGLDAYHDKGDEFLFRGASPEDLRQKLEAAREDLRNRTIEVTLADGSKRQFKGADFSYGTGQESAQAETGLKEHKAEREARGERARGELRGINEVGPKTGEAVSGTAEKPAAERFRELTRERTERTAAGGEETDLFGNRIEKPAGEVKPGDVGRMNVADLKLDPKRFQYKMNTDATGVTNLLKGRRWNEDLAGIISAWQDPENGKTYVVNGHHRFQLAEENHRPSVNVRMIDAPTAEAARATGALQNIAEGRGTPMDAAKFFRDSGFTPEHLEDLGVSMREATAANGVALARLDPHLFDQVVTGKLAEGRAIAIGTATADAAEQESILKLINKAEAKGKHVTNETVNELARMVKGAGEHTSTQATLFGAQEMVRNLALEKAEISSYIRKEIGTERRTFESVSDEKRAKRLGAVEGQKITAEQNAAIAEKARHAQELYDRLSVRSGTIDEILNRAARELAEGGKPNDVKSKAYEEARAALAETLRTGADRGPEGVQAQPARPAEPGAGLKSGRETGQPPREVAKGAPVILADGKAGVIEHYQTGVNGGPERVRVRLTDGTMREGVKPQDVKPIPAPAEHPGEPWIGVDFDKTLAHYETFKGPEYTGKPIPEMVDRVKKALNDGKNVKIFTARVADDPTGRARAALEAWSQEHLGRTLPITNVKDQYMSEIWDDRAKQVVPNTGKMVEGAGNAENEAARATPSKAAGNARNISASSEERATAGAGSGGIEPVVPVPAPEAGANNSGPESSSPIRRESKNPTLEQGGAGPAGAIRRPSETSAELQERLLAKGRFERELQAARGRKTSENITRAQVETKEVNGNQFHVLNPDAYAFLEKQLTPGKGWVGAALDSPAASRWIAELRASESLARQKRLPQEADAFRKMALDLDKLRDPDGGLVLLRSDHDDATMREELIHRWQQRTGLYGSGALDAITELPEVERAIEGLKDIGYRDVALKERTAEAMAKAMAGDPDWTLSRGARRELVRRFATAAVDEMGPQVLDNLPPVLPEVEDVIREVQQYGRQQTQGEGPGAARRGAGQTSEGLSESEGAGGRAPDSAGQRRPVSEQAGRGVQQERPAQSELENDELFKKSRPVRPEDSLALPGMEDVDRERADAEAAEQGRLLTEAMRKPQADISQAAGEMERDSPLFFGTGDNPTLFKRDPEAEKQNPWFLKSERVVADKMKGPMPAEDLKRMLENNGVRAEEMKWSGLGDFLEKKGREKVTAAEVAEAIRAGSIKVKDVWHEDVSDQEMSRRIAAGEGPGGQRPTRYRQYTEPGGENYRELLLTLPESKTGAAPEPLSELPDGYEVGVDYSQNPDRKYHVLPPNQGHARPFHGRHPSPEAATRAALEAINNQRVYEWRDSQPSFETGHWQERNVLAHVRMNDRALPDGGRSLHLEELQSDWHQKGRQQGYRGDRLPAHVNELIAQVKKLGIEKQPSRISMQDVANAGGSSELQTAWFNAVRDGELRPLTIGLPDAPFKKDWHEMALRRMLQHAAENGYDALAWTPGDLQNDRYALAKHIRRITYEPRGEGKHALWVEGRNGDMIHDTLAEGVPDGGWDDRAKAAILPTAELENIFGKEVAQKIVNGEGAPPVRQGLDNWDASKARVRKIGEQHQVWAPNNESGVDQFRGAFDTPEEAGKFVGRRMDNNERTLSDLDLKVGGEGMRGFYDKIIPDYLNKFGKQFGAKVGTVRLEGESPWRDLYVSKAGEGVYEVFDRADDYAPPVQEFGSQREAEEFINRAKSSKSEMLAQSLPITDKMRASLRESGVPLFKREPPRAPEEEENDRMVAMHNTTAEGIRAADKLGGIPAPSLAVLRPGMDFSSYGDVTLVGNKNLVDPAVNPDARLYDADVYSPRQPRASRKLNERVADKFEKMVRDTMPSDAVAQALHARYGIRDKFNSYRADQPEELVRQYKNDEAVQYAWLKSKGLEPEEFKESPVRRNFTFLDRPEVKAAIDQHPEWIADIDKLDTRAVSTLVRDAHHASIDDDIERIQGSVNKKQAASVARSLEADKKEWEARHLDENGDLHWNPLDSAFRDLRNIQTGKQEIDEYEARDAIRAAVIKAGGTEAMEPWLEKNLEGAFGEEYLQTGRGKKPYTIDNVRQAMLGSGVRGQEDTMTHGLGKARAVASRSFKDLEQMRRERGRIVSEADAAKAHDELNNRFFKWRDELQYRYPDQWDSLDSLGKAIGRYLKGPKNEAGMRRALMAEDFKDEGLSPETLRTGMKLAADVQNAPAEYFEAKLRNATKLADYAGAAVPRNAPEDVKQTLRSHGLRVEEYDSNDKASRTAAIAKLHSEPGALFKREPATTVTTGDHDTGKAIEDTVRELERIPSRKLSPSERIDEASKLAVGQAKGAATGIAKAGAALKGTWAGIVNSASSPAPWTSYFESLKGLRQGEFRAALELDKYQKRMREVAPSERERAAMTIFGEARDEQELKRWADQARQAAKYRGPDPEKASAAKSLGKHIDAFDDALKLTDRQKQIAAEHARYYDQQLQLLMDAGLLPKGASRYAMHMFAGDPEALAQAQAVTDFSELAPNPAFLKRRVYPSYFDAMTHGETPRTLDAGKILSAYHDAFTKTFLTRGFLRSLIGAHDELDGRPLAALESRAGFNYVKADSPEAKQIIRQPRRPADLTGYVRIPASQLKNFKWELTDADREMLSPGYKDLPEAEQQKLFGGEDSQYPAKPGEILALRGDVLLHPSIAGRVSDLLMRSALDRKQMDPVLEVGRKAVRGIQTAGAKLKSGILTYSLFHQTQLGVHALEHMTNPMRLGELTELAKDPVVLEGVGHGLNLMSVDSEGVLASHLGLPGMETYHRYLFRDYIPRLKAETYKNAFSRNLKRYSGELTKDEIHLLTAKQVNNGFGGLDPAFYRHLYRMNNKTWKSLEHLAFFSPDFTKARLGFVGQAFGRYGQEQRMALGLGLVTIYSVARITNALMNNGDAHWNWRDALQVEIPKSVPLVGGQRIGLRTVQADMLNLIKDPKTFAYNRLNPITLRPTIEFLTGRDNMGRQQTTEHFAKNYAKQMTPIPVQKLFTTSDDRWADALLQSAGLESGKYRTPLETVAHKLYVEGLPDMPEDEDKQNEARARVQRVEELRRLADNPQALKSAQDKVWQDAQAGKMTERQAKALLERASMTELQYEVSRMKKMEDALTVWDQANAQEREELHDIIAQKAARQTKQMDDEQAQQFIAKLKTKGIDLE